MWRLAVVALGMAGLACGRYGFDPSAAPNLDLSLCPQLDGVTLTRSTAATYFDSSGLLQTAAPDQPRCAYDPNTGALMGLLVEGTRTNYVTNAIGSGSDVDGLPLGWSSQHTTDTTAAGSVTASPTFVGFQEADIAITGDAVNGQYYQVMFTLNVTESDVDYTFSLFARSQSGLGGCSVLIQTWTADFGGATQGQIGSGVQAPGSAWERVSYAFYAPATTAIIQAFYSCGVAENSSYELDLAAPQLEVGGASSPILTMDVPVTRAADLVTLAQAPLLQGEEGTIVLDVTNNDDTSAPRTALELDDTEPAMVQNLSYGSAAWSAAFADTTTTMIAAPIPDGFHRVGYRWSSTSSGIVVDGALSFGAGVSPNDGVSATLGSSNGGAALFGAISRFRHWLVSLSDTDVTQATAL